MSVYSDKLAAVRKILADSTLNNAQKVIRIHKATAPGSTSSSPYTDKVLATPGLVSLWKLGN